MPFIQGALFSTMNAGTDLARDIQTGFINRLSLTALRDWALLAASSRGRRRSGSSRCSSTSPSASRLGVDFESGPAGIAVLIVYGAIVALSFGALGACLAFRTGSGETIQALFPVLFVFLFISSMNAPREPDRRRLVPDAATLNPVSYMIECVRSLIIDGLGPAGARARVRLRDRARHRLALARLVGAPDPDDEDVRPWVWNVVMGRRLADAEERAHEPADPPADDGVPALLLHRVRGWALAAERRPGFDYPPGYTAFQFVFVLLQSAAFGGVFTGFGVARDFEGGFAKRLLLAAPHRSGIVLGYALAALVRWLIVAVALTASRSSSG